MNTYTLADHRAFIAACRPLHDALQAERADDQSVGEDDARDAARHVIRAMRGLIADSYLRIGDPR